MGSTEARSQRAKPAQTRTVKQVEADLRFIENYLSGKAKHPGDFVNNTVCYDPGPNPGTEETEHLRAFTILRIMVGLEATEGLDISFKKEAITNGEFMYNLVEKCKDKVLAATEARYGESFLTTQRADRLLAKEIRDTQVTESNKIKAQTANRKAARSLPDHALFSPINSEGIVIEQKKDHAMSLSGSLQDWAFEMFYITFLRMKARDMNTSLPFILEGDGVYSRNGAPEDIEGEVQNFGLFYDFVGGTHSKFVDINGKPVPFYDRVFEGAKHVFDVTERGFRADFAVVRLLVQFMYYDWIVSGKGPIKVDQLPKDLQRLASDPKAQARIEELKALIFPYLAQKCASWTPYGTDKDLKAYVEKNVLPLADNEIDVAAMEKKLFSYLPAGGFPGTDRQQKFPKAKGKVSKAFSASTEVAKRRGTDGKAFSRKPSMFADHHFDRLRSEREQAALKIAMNGLEVIDNPDNRPNSFFFACEAKGGPEMYEYAKKKGFDWLKEAQNAAEQSGDEYAEIPKSVIDRSIKFSLEEKDKFRRTKAFKDLKVGQCVSTHNINNISRAFELLPAAVMDEDGAKRLSPKAKHSLAIEYIRRNAVGFVVRDKWFVDAKETQQMIEALQVATGLYKRSGDDSAFPDGDYKMDIYRIKNGRLTKLDLADIFLEQGAHVEKLIETKVPDEAAYQSAMRLHRMIGAKLYPKKLNYKFVQIDRGKWVESDPLINWAQVNPDLHESLETDRAKKEKVEALYNRLSEKLVEVAPMLPTITVNNQTFDPLENVHWTFINRRNEEEVKQGFEQARKGVRQAQEINRRTIR